MKCLRCDGVELEVKVRGEGTDIVEIDICPQCRGIWLDPEELQKLDDNFFLDIEKKDYIRALPHCETLLRRGGLLLADNVAFKGSEDFNRALYERPGWRAVHLYSFLPYHSPDMDGLCLALRV